ncbi:transferase, transferring glycosyl group [Artemisia annua]|uniref:Transferase, transferring glycosyl group n=1 Tax=Artemisia annua TaxID=35608 RepID=A0A2U1ML96_ARTAN|nr:transferase, transferring glycosyl group [Artemisia annua]
MRLTTITTTTTTTTLILLITTIILVPTNSETPTPAKWPDQFHSILVMNKSGTLELIDLWYDWTNGRNFNIIQHQLGNILYDLEWNNGTSFYYTLDSDKTCSSAQLEVGILRPNWLDGSEYIGQKELNGFLCNVWTKAEFITYYEDVVSKRPVGWVFYTGREAHVMTFEVGAALEDAKWQVPWYCFQETNNATTTMPDVSGAITQRSLVDFGTRNVQDM